MSNKNTFLACMGIMMASLTIAIVFQDPKEARQSAAVYEYNTRGKAEVKVSTNFVYDRDSNKIVPLTILSPEDAKKDCVECHAY